MQYSNMISFRGPLPKSLRLLSCIFNVFSQLFQHALTHISFLKLSLGKILMVMKEELSEGNAFAEEKPKISKMYFSLKRDTESVE